METTIPLSGFYETIHHHAIEDRYDVGDGVDVDEGEGKKRYDEYLKNYKEEEINYCREYTKNFSELTQIPLKFKEMTSPREYNFTTDRIFAEIHEDDLWMLKNIVDPVKIREYVKKHYTSRDGFMSFYDNSYDEWLKQEKPFDHNQIGALLEVYAEQVDSDWEMEVYDDTQGNF